MKAQCPKKLYFKIRLNLSLSTNLFMKYYFKQTAVWLCIAFSLD